MVKHIRFFLLILFLIFAFFYLKDRRGERQREEAQKRMETFLNEGVQPQNEDVHFDADP